MVSTWRDVTPSAGYLGYRIGRLDYFNITNSPSLWTTNGVAIPSSYSPNWVGQQTLINLGAHANGLPYSPAGANGAYFGTNRNVFMNASSTGDNFELVADGEDDITFGGNNVGSAWKKMGRLIRDSGVRGFTQDNGLTFSTNNTYATDGDLGTFRTVISFNANPTTGPSAPDSILIGADRRETGSNVHQLPAKYLVDGRNLNLTSGGCFFAGVNYCVDSNGYVNTGKILVTQGIQQQSTTISAINVISSAYPITGYITGSVLTLSTMAHGGLAIGQTINCPTCTPTMYNVVGGPASGTGVAGSTYNLAQTCTANCGSSGTPSSMTTGRTALGPWGWVGGGYVMVNASALPNAVAFPNVNVAAPPSGGTTAVAAVGSMFLQGLAVPQGFIAANGCVNNDTVTITLPGSGTPGQLQLTVTANGITAGTVVVAGSQTAITAGSAITVTGGSCGAGIANAILPYVLYGIGSVTVSNAGAGYPCNGLPVVSEGGGHTSTTEHPATFEAVLGTCTTAPVNFANGISGLGVQQTLMQSAIPMILPPSGYIDANGNVVLGQTVGSSATLSFSGTSGSVTATFSAGTPLTGTSAGDVNRYIVVLDTIYKTCLITAFSSSTVATCTLSATLSGTGPFANANVWLSGTNATTNTAGADTVMHSAPLSGTYSSAYLYFPASSPIGVAGEYYCAMASPVTGTCYNNAYTSGTPAIPGSPTAFSGLTAGTYTQTTASTLALLTASLAGNTLGSNGCVNWDVTYGNNNSAGTKTFSTKLGNTGPGVAPTTQAYGKLITRGCNAGAANAQVYDGTQTSPTAVTVQAIAPTTSAANTAVSQNIVVNLNLATATDEGEIRAYMITARPN